MTTYTCHFCSKLYKRKSCFNNHLEKCRLHKYCRNNNLDNNLDNHDNVSSINFNNIKIDDSVNNNNIDLQNISFSNENIFKLLVVLFNKYEKLEADYNELKSFVNVSKSKINIIDYLNKNYDSLKIDYKSFINTINIDREELEIIFKHDYVDGFIQILINYIEKYKYNNRQEYDEVSNNSNNNIYDLPIKCFNHKEGEIYIYLNDAKWCIMNDDNICYMIKYFNKRLMNNFLTWKNENSDKIEKDDNFCQTYIKNMKKVMANNFVKKNVNLLIKNKLYKLLKINFKNLVSYEFA
tara:strand:- start:917 stop:1798 length:882 start_codon:yes stop_codon:yes gene_type:complete